MSFTRKNDSPPANLGYGKWRPKDLPTTLPPANAFKARTPATCNSQHPLWHPNYCACYCPFDSDDSKLNVADGYKSNASGCPNDWYTINEATCSCSCEKAHPSTFCQASLTKPFLTKENCMCECPAEVE